MKLKYLILSVLFWIFGLPAVAEPNKVVTVAFAYSYPLIYMNGSEAEGLYVDVLRQVFEEEFDYKLSFVQRPWKRSQRDVQVGEADVFITVPTAERLVYATATKFPVYVLERKVYTRAYHPKFAVMAAVRSVEDLVASGLTVTTNIGDSWHMTELTDKGVPTLIVPDLTNSFLLVADGRADAVVNSGFTANRIIAQKELQGRILDTGGTVQSVETYILIGRKSWLAAHRHTINNALEKITSDGRLASITKKYMETGKPTP